MKILIVGDCNSPYIIEQSQWLRKNARIERVDIFSTTVPTNNSIENYYDNLFCYFKKIDLDALSHFDEMSQQIIINYIRISEFKSLNNYEIIQIHFVDVSLWSLISYFKSVGKKVITSIWGSDLLRSTEDEDRFRTMIYDASDVITFAQNETMLNTFKNKYPNYLNKKYTNISFGADIFQNLSKLKKSMNKGKCKALLNIEKNKIIITIGYQANKNHRQVEVLDLLLKNRKILENLDKIQFFLPLTYGAPKHEKEKIINHFYTKKVDFVYFDHYLSVTQVCMIRYASDIFINLLTTDAFSNSMREYLYAENIVITGEWLPYGGLLQKGYYFKTLDTIDAIGEVSAFVIENIDEEKKYCRVNDDTLLDYADWSLIIKEWLKIYEDTLFEQSKS